MKVWECKVCSSSLPWSDDHQWYGSLLDLDGGRWKHAPQPIVVTCSDLCRDRAAVIGIVPADAPLLK
jgi:hypothetical protein